MARIRKVTTNQVAAMAKTSAEEVEKADGANFPESSPKRLRVFLWESEEYRQALKTRELSSFPGDYETKRKILHRNVTDAIMEGELSVATREEIDALVEKGLDRDRIGDREVHVLTPESHRISYKRWKEWHIQQPKTREEASREGVRLQEKIRFFNQLNPGLKLNEDELMAPVRKLYRRIELGLEDTNGDYGAVFRQALESIELVEKEASDFLSKEVRKLIETASEKGDFDKEELAAMQDQAEKAKSLKSFEDQRRAYAALEKKFSDPSFLGKDDDRGFNAPHRRDDQPKFDRNRGRDSNRKRDGKPHGYKPRF